MNSLDQIDNNIKTPLDNQLDHLGKIITIASYCIASIILVMRIVMFFISGETFEWLGFAQYLLNTLMMAVTIIVVSVPEGLPMSVTLSLALSMKRMLTANNLVRKMHACETMGAATVICTDKTGTLTQNQMSVNDMSFLALPEKQLSGNEISNLIKESLALNTTAFLDFSDEKKIKAIGNPTEGALLLWLNKQGVDYMNIREGVKMYQQVPFSTKYKFMASIVESPSMGKPIFYVKGAPEILLKHCNKISTPEEMLILPHIVWMLRNNCWNIKVKRCVLLHSHTKSEILMNNPLILIPMILWQRTLYCWV